MRTEYLSLRSIQWFSLLIRFVLICYGELQDRNFVVKFTDIDYHVFSDAAKHIMEGRSPFLRPTYRYTPLLAILLTPNHFLFYPFGKFVFVACDLIAGWLIHRILTLQGVGEGMKLVSCSLWLLNPLTATVSSRGNAESILAVLVLLTLYFVMCKQVILSAVVFGLAVHVKVFPLIYSLPLFLLLNESYHCGVLDPAKGQLSTWRAFLNASRLKFTFISALTFVLITALLYARYGNEFIQEAYLYHVTRRDTRHNFSVYFYMLYLIQDTWLSFPIGLIAFLPQVLLLVMASLWLYRDISFCCFVQTFMFVTFNKVCTSQYFLWYLCLLPLVLPFSRLRLRDAVMMGTVWFLGQGIWLAPAYLLEFQGYNTFVLIWLAGLLFFAINVCMLATIIKNHQFRSVFISGQTSFVQCAQDKLD